MAATDAAGDSLRLSAELTEMEKELAQERAEEARANGYSCWDDYFRFLEEEARAIRPEDVARILRDHPSPVEWFPAPPECDCEDYKSQDMPDLTGILDSRHRLKPDEIKIREGDKSKRLDQGDLEQYWGQERFRQEPQMKIPFWANADGVVQKIIHQGPDRRDVSISPSPSPPLRTPSLLYNNTASGPPSFEDTTMTDPTSTFADVGSDSQAPPDPEKPLSELPQSGPADSHKGERESTGIVGKLIKARRKPKGGIVGRRPVANARVTKRSWKPAMGLRSSKVTKFYELA
ncbi:MAG: hypothetical protein Q9166_005926 [cf. Caloplaca sp. 2 TL-2023]